MSARRGNPLDTLASLINIFLSQYLQNDLRNKRNILSCWKKKLEVFIWLLRLLANDESRLIRMDGGARRRS